MRNFIDLSGKSAVVTGAAQGIGLAIAAILAEAGARVTAIDRNAALLDAVGARFEGRIHAASLDITDEAAVAECCRRVRDSMGLLDILVNAAGVISPNVSAELVEMDDFDRVIAVNLKGGLIMAKHCFAFMKAAGGGAVVNLSSQAALLSLPHQAAYTASKGGVSALTRSLAIDWAPARVRVNAIAPTFIRTPMTEPMLADPAVLAAAERRIPLGRVGTPDDIAHLALFLASDLSSLMTGQTLAVDGGWSIGEPSLDLLASTFEPRFFGNRGRKGPGMSFATINGIKLWYESTGEGEPVVQIQGCGFGHFNFAAATPIISRHFRSRAPAPLPATSAWRTEQPVSMRHPTAASRLGMAAPVVLERVGVAALLLAQHEHQLSVRVPGQTQIKRGAPVFEGKGARDRHGEPAFSREPGKLPQRAIAQRALEAVPNA